MANQPSAKLQKWILGIVSALFVSFLSAVPIFLIKTTSMTQKIIDKQEYMEKRMDTFIGDVNSCKVATDEKLKVHNIRLSNIEQLVAAHTGKAYPRVGQ